MDKQEKSPESRIILVVAVTMMLTTACIFFAFFATKSAMVQSIFGCKRSSFVGKDYPQKTQWSSVDRLDIPEKHFSIIRLDQSHLCYLLPYELRGEVPYEAQPLVVKEQALGYDEVESLAGEDAALLCAGRKTHIVHPIKEEIGDEVDLDLKYENPIKRISDRVRRQAKDGYPLSGIFASAVDKGKPALEIDIDERQPRCVNVLLDCYNHVGEAQLCYTWQNGAMFMERKCLDKNKFEIKMTKPPGRILKVAQQHKSALVTVIDLRMLFIKQNVPTLKRQAATSDKRPPRQCSGNVLSKAAGDQRGLPNSWRRPSWPPILFSRLHLRLRSGYRRHQGKLLSQV
uniref:Uncharacterized protein n=1 Tax=Trichuris muris TaxID=70415 RepID=A0A5S6R4I5_TRIMR